MALNKYFHTNTHNRLTRHENDVLHKTKEFLSFYAERKNFFLYLRRETSELTSNNMQMKKLTGKEEEIMDLFWKHGPMFIQELQTHYAEPQPLFNTLSAQVRTLEKNGYMTHESFSGAHKYRAAISREDYGKMSITGFTDKCFGNSFKRMVSCFVEDKKLTVDELKELIDAIEKGRTK